MHPTNEYLPYKLKELMPIIKDNPLTHKTRFPCVIGQRNFSIYNLQHLQIGVQSPKARQNLSQECCINENKMSIHPF